MAMEGLFRQLPHHAGCSHRSLGQRGLGRDDGHAHLHDCPSVENGPEDAARGQVSPQQATACSGLPRGALLSHRAAGRGYGGFHAVVCM